MGLALQAGRLDVDAWLAETTAEQLTEWEAYFHIQQQEAEPDRLPFDVQSQEDIAGTMARLK